MGIKRYKPVTPGLRFRATPDFAEITKTEPEKSLLVKYTKTGGRNNYGHRSMRYRGGGHKKRYRLIDFKRDKIDIPAKVLSIEYNPIATARIALVCYKDGEKRYILAPAELKVGDEIISSENAPIKPGNTLPLHKIPEGTLVHNVELRPGEGGKIARAAGTYAQVLGFDGDYAILQLPSTEIRKIHKNCKATIGTLSFPEHNLEMDGKAGRTRHKGRRPRTRAVAMNPVDHPMGGGEGRHSGGHPRSRKGIYAIGYKTVRKFKPSHAFIIQKRKKKSKNK